ncbi:MAG: TraR/DksA C4-type zinc finger protein [Actinomycetota bacterium]
MLAEEHALQRTRAAELRDTEDLEPDLAEVLLARCQEALEETEAALDLIEREVYGLCAECGAPIPYERLEVVPATRRCVACQSGRDRVLR